MNNQIVHVRCRQIKIPQAPVVAESVVPIVRMDHPDTVDRYKGGGETVHKQAPTFTRALVSAEHKSHMT